LIRDAIAGRLHRQALSLDLAFFESPEYHDRLEQSRNEAGSRSRSLLQSAGSLLQNGITLLAMAALLMTYGIWLPIVLLISTLPAFYVVMHFNRRYHRWWQAHTPDRRRADYYDLLLTHSATAPEMRAFGLGPHFESAYQLLRERLRREHLQQLRDQSLGHMAAGLLALLVAAVAVSWMGWQALLGRFTLGDVALFYQAFSRGQNLMRALLGSIGQIYKDTLFVGNLFAFLELQPKVVDPPRPVPPPYAIREGIRLRNVTFRYPGSETPALSNFNLTIPAGQVVAIVGPNGAGKTTLTKLLCRFYDPDAGSVELDGVDLREFSLSELRNMITVLFQFPMPYQLSAAQNIALGDINREPTTAALEAAARSAGAHDRIARLPQGYTNQLGRWFSDGAELSGGEWQRIATARAFFRQAPIILLDEPTSAMDSWAEADWFERLRNLASGRTSLIIPNDIGDTASFHA
jgi:ATP-binding cassette subfamily B protein